MSSRYDDVPKVTLESLDQRLENVERVLLAMQAQMTPKWLRIGGWATFLGVVLGTALKVAFE